MRIEPSNVPTSRRTEAAYTFAEVLIAVGLILVVFVSLYVGLSFGFAVTRAERENLRATQIMLERMEGIRLFTFDQLQDPTLNPPAFTNYFYPNVNTNQSQGIAYIGTMTVVTNPTMSPAATYNSNMLQLTVALQWTSGNISRNRSMTTYVARNGIQTYVYTH